MGSMVSEVSVARPPEPEPTRCCEACPCFAGLTRRPRRTSSSTAPGRKETLFTCSNCSHSVKDVAAGDLGTLLCQQCLRAEDEARLEPLTAEERVGLDKMALILDSVPWSYFKPGEQPAKILDWLYLGDLKEAMDLNVLGDRDVTAVMNCINWWELNSLVPEDDHLPAVYGAHGIDYNEVDSEDRLFYDIVAEAWPRAEEALKAWRDEGRKVLVNCRAGHNRSACIVVCWLFCHEGMTLLDAVHHVQDRRGTILSNHGFRLSVVRKAIELRNLGEVRKPADGCKVVKKQGARTKRRGPCAVPAASGGHFLQKIINDKRLTVNYGKDADGAHWKPSPLRELRSSRARFDSVIGAGLERQISDQKVTVNSLAGRLHLHKNLLEDFEYTTNPPTAIGSGYSGDVLLCRRIGTLEGSRSLRCVKTFKHKAIEQDDIEKLKNEATIYLSLDHPCIARLFDVYEDENELSLVMNYCAGGTLEDVVRTGGVFSEPGFKQTAMQMGRAVNYLHHKGFIHRDIKPRNWVYEADCSVVKLIDFGFSVHLNPRVIESNAPGADVEGNGKAKGVFGTLGYLAPELIQSGWASDASYTEKCDIWSLAAVNFELLTAFPAFGVESGTCDGYTEDIAMREIAMITTAEVEQKLAAVPYAGARTLLARMLTLSPDERPSAFETLNDPYLSEARAVLHRPANALSIPQVIDRLSEFGKASAPTRSTLLALAQAPPFSPEDLMELRATFDMFDALRLDGIITREAFIERVAEEPATSSLSDGSPSQRMMMGRSPTHALALMSPRASSNRVSVSGGAAAAAKAWAAATGSEGTTMTFCDFIAALLPSFEDAFEDALDDREEATVQSTFASELSVVEEGPGEESGEDAVATASFWDADLPIAAFFRHLPLRLRPIQSMIFGEEMPVKEVVKAMAEAHYRWVIISKASGMHAFFDYMDINYQLSKLPAGKSLGDGMSWISNLPVGVVANSSGYCPFVPMAAEEPLKDILALLAGKGRGAASAKSIGGTVHRIPIVGPSGELLRVFSCVDFLKLGCAFSKPAAVMKSRSSRTFDNRDAILQVSVPHDATIRKALDIMNSTRVTICPVTMNQLSGTGGAAVGVLSVSDLKLVVTSENHGILDQNISDFMAWRRRTIKERSDVEGRFNVVSVDANETVHAVASRLLSTKLQRIFLSSGETSRIVGMISSRDVLIKVFDQLVEADTFGLVLPRRPSKENLQNLGSSPNGALRTPKGHPLGTLPSTVPALTLPLPARQ